MKYLAPFVLLMLVGCSTQPTVKSWLDPVSLVTITAQAEPLVLIRLEQRRTINGRDFAQLAAIEVNRMGDRRLYLIAALWSNAQLSGQQWQNFESSFAQVELRLDDHAIKLTRHAGDLSTLHIGQSPLPLPLSGSRHVFFSIERADLRAMVQSNLVQLTTLGGPGAPQRFEEREDGRQSLGDFLSQLPGESSNMQSRSDSRQGESKNVD